MRRTRESAFFSPLSGVSLVVAALFMTKALPMMLMTVMMSVRMRTIQTKSGYGDDNAGCDDAAAVILRLTWWRW